MPQKKVLTNFVFNRKVFDVIYTDNIILFISQFLIDLKKKL